jgi:crossover junction endodeoxyribonuclease RusA
MTENNTISKVILVLPYPPSVNTYWGFNGSRRYLTKKAVEFKKLVWAECLLAGKPSFDNQLVKVSITWHCPDRRLRDIDNPIKPLFDALVQSSVFEDDSQIRFMTVQYGEIKKGGQTVVVIELF